MEYIIHILILIGIYIILAESLNILIGYTGLLSIGHAAFYGIGAYTAAIMSVRFNCPTWTIVVCGILLSASTGWILGVPSCLVNRDRFVIVTLAFQVAIFGLFNNFVFLTGGPAGMPGIPRPTILGWKASTHSEFFLLVVLSSIVVVWINKRIAESPLGRVLRAIREDELFAESLGKKVAAYKMLVLAVSSGIAALAGMLYAFYVSYIDPTSFNVMESVFVISIVIIGGAGNAWGPILGAVVLITLHETLRFMGLPTTTAANIRQILYGGSIVTLMMFRRQGIVGEFSFHDIKEDR